MDVVDVDDTQVASAVEQIASSFTGRRLVVLHARTAPVDDLDLSRMDLVQEAGDRDQLAARFGAGRHLRVHPVGDPMLAAASRGVPQLPETPQPLANVREQLPDGPIFVGGTGRSGTWAVGRLVNSHPNWVTIHTELRFHVHPPGFVGVLRGESTPQEFARIVQDTYFRQKGGTGMAKGLQLVATRHELRRALNAFVRRAGDDVPAALGQLMLDLVAPFVRGRGGLGFTETTPNNVAAADALTAVLPTARVVQMVRDGRDVAASVASMAWGPNDIDSGLDWWASRIREGHEALAAADPDRVATFRLEELIALDRDRTFERLVDFLGFTETELLRRYFDSQMDEDRANVGRWRRDMDAGERKRFERRYRKLLDRLAADGVECLPADPEAVDELADA